MTDAAALTDMEPRQISFTGTLQAVVPFIDAAWNSAAQNAERAYRGRMQAVVVHRAKPTGSRRAPRCEALSQGARLPHRAARRCQNTPAPRE